MKMRFSLVFLLSAAATSSHVAAQVNPCFNACVVKAEILFASEIGEFKARAFICGFSDKAVGTTMKYAQEVLALRYKQVGLTQDDALKDVKGGYERLIDRHNHDRGIPACYKFSQASLQLEQNIRSEQKALDRDQCTYGGGCDNQ